jgi:hypothetical protein
MLFRILKGLFFISIALGLGAGCASSAYLSANELAPGKSLSQLKRMGMELGDPTTVETLEQSPSVKAAYSGDDWEQFKLLLQPGDELRELSYKIEYGVAIFRHGNCVASFMPVLVMR